MHWLCLSLVLAPATKSVLSHLIHPPNHLTTTLFKFLHSKFLLFNLKPLHFSTTTIFLVHQNNVCSNSCPPCVAQRFRTHCRPERRSGPVRERAGLLRRKVVRRQDLSGALRQHSRTLWCCCRGVLPAFARHLRGHACDSHSGQHARWSKDSRPDAKAHCPAARQRVATHHQPVDSDFRAECRRSSDLLSCHEEGASPNELLDHLPRADAQAAQA
jgi:hypothetical protein